MDETEELVPAARLQIMRIIAGALLAGVLMFFGLVLFLVWGQNQGHGMQRPQAELPLISLLAAGMLLINAPLSFIIPAVQLRAVTKGLPAQGSGKDARQARADLAGHLLGVAQTAMIVGLALLEGAAFFACIAYLLEAQWFTLAVVVVAVVLMLLKFPNRGRLAAWIQQQLDQAMPRPQSGFLPPS